MQLLVKHTGNHEGWIRPRDRETSGQVLIGYGPHCMALDESVLAALQTRFAMFWVEVYVLVLLSEPFQLGMSGTEHRTFYMADKCPASRL